MSERFRVSEALQPLPPTAADANPAAAMRGLYLRVAKLEQALEEERSQATAEMRDVLSALLSLTDDIAAMVERWGVATSAQEVALVRSVVSLGKTLQALLQRHGVKAIETLGKPLDSATSDVVGTETRSDVPDGTVLREEKAGFLWPHGLLRRAQVVVSVQPERRAPSVEGDTEAGPEDALGPAQPEQRAAQTG
ncbi:MAG: nucleotide exchange factor GrpE [Chloroflexi bacterium]|nr:nucleotide exchange factor GrpE [Chloroflexota bacterium]